MALVKCQECSREVSDQAQACPGCGAPLRQSPPPPANYAVTNSVRVERAGARWEIIGFLMIVVGMIVGVAGGGAFGGIVFFLGFFVFLVGRLIN